MNTSISTAEFAQLLPHAEPMILIAAVTNWDTNSITCLANSHLAMNNPLRQEGILSVYAGVEYAAQAMAVHARLSAPDADKYSQPRKGFLAVASKLTAKVPNLDQAAGLLLIKVERIAANNDSSLYHFNISSAEQDLLEGQLMAIMEVVPN